MNIQHPTKTQILRAERLGRKIAKEYRIVGEGQKMARQKSRRFCKVCGAFRYTDKFPDDGKVCDNCVV